MSQDESEAASADERRAHRRAIAARRERVLVASRVVAVALVAVVAAGVLLRVPETWWVPAVGFVALAGLVFRLVNWRCPACGEPLPTRSGRSCRGCGLPIDEGP